MVINLCREEELVNNRIVTSHLHDTILDIAGVVYPTVKKVVSLADVDSEGTIEEDAINRYVDFVGTVSRTSLNRKLLTSYKVVGCSVFWITPFAEKHDSYHWGKDVWTLYSLLLCRRDFFAGQTAIVLMSEKYRHVATLVRQFFSTANLAEPRFVFLGDSQKNFSFFPFLVNTAKGFLKNRRLIKKAKSLQESVAGAENIFVSNIANKNGIASDIDLSELFKFSSSTSTSIAVPFFNTYQFDMTGWSKLDKGFTRAAPGFWQLVLIFRSQLRVYFQLFKSRNESVEVNGFRISGKMLGREMLQSCEALFYLNYLWMRNYFSAIQSKTNIFFADEFYISGRIISSAAIAAKNDLVTSHGIQHGLLLNNHTVYRISDKELFDATNKKVVFPKPDKFIVWGEYFKNLFVKTNSLREQVLVAGNLKYILLYKKNTDMPAGKTISTKRILWCTSLPAFFKSEYEILKGPLLKHNDYSLTFRLHPVGHIQKEEVVQWVAPDIMERAGFSDDSSIFEDMEHHDIVISTSFSTAFFDALMMKKISCRMITGVLKADFRNDRIKNLFDIRDAADFENVLQGRLQAVLSDEEAIDIQDFCYLKEDRWRDIFSHD